MATCFLRKMKFVVFDIDETLVYSEAAELDADLVETSDYFFVRPISRQIVFKVHKRKNLDSFLDRIEQKFRIIVWSAGGESYVKDIVSVIFKNRKVDYVFTYNHLIDDVKKLMIIKEYVPDFKIEDSKLVDDNEAHMVDQEDYFLTVKPFKGKQDEELEKIYSKLMIWSEKP